MDGDGIVHAALEALSRELFQLGGRPISAATILTVAAIMLAAWTLSRLTQRALRRASQLRGVQDEGNVAVVARLVHFGFLLVGFGVSVQAVGIDLAGLFAAGAVFAVAIGFAVQNIAQSFVAGVILLGERSIKPGDVLEVQGQLVKVKHIGIRATVVRSLDDEHLIVPNGSLVQSTVKNYTHEDPFFRLRAEVGVVYSSNMDHVQRVLEETAAALPWRSKEREPVVLLTGFGSSSVDFEVSVWIEDPWAQRRMKSQLLHAVWDALKAEAVVIAFPQVDVHLDAGVSRGFEALGAADRGCASGRAP